MMSEYAGRSNRRKPACWNEITSVLDVVVVELGIPLEWTFDFHGQ
jgi:hypothetical protein